MFNVGELLKATQGKLISGSQDIEVKGISIDSRTIKKGQAFIAIKGNNFDGHDFIEGALKKGAACIIYQVKSGIRKPKGRVFLEVRDSEKALGDIAYIHRRKFNIPVIAITGSNGKTTTKEMVAWVLSGKYNVLKNEGTKNNQIGLPMALLDLNQGHDIAVLEIGTNHFGEVNYLANICRPNIGIITNIGPSHFEYLHDLKGVTREKVSLLANLEKPRIAILNADDKLLRDRTCIKNKGLTVFSFGIKNKSDFYASDIKQDNNKLKFNLNSKFKFKLKALGYHNASNALIAIGIGRIFGMGYNSIASRLSSFDLPEGRLKFIKLNQVSFIDDSYNSNPLSLMQALDVLNNFKTEGRKIFVMGDMLELGNQEKAFHYQAGRYAAKICDKIITVGGLSKLAANAAKSCGFDFKDIFTCASIHEARNILFSKIYPRNKDVVLVKGSRMMKMEGILKT